MDQEDYYKKYLDYRLAKLEFKLYLELIGILAIVAYLLYRYLYMPLEPLLNLLNTPTLSRLLEIVNSAS